jgi:selenocysteine lyase/cysteine desulfurase
VFPLLPPSLSFKTGLEELICSRWLYTPRASAVFYVPFRKQHLIRSSIPTGVYYEESETSLPKGKTAFVHMFEFVATADFSPYLVIPAALKWRREVCGGEEAIRSYCDEISRVGGAKIAEVLGTEVLGEGFEGSRMTECGFANVRLPLAFAVDGDGDGEKKAEGKGLKVEDAGRIGLWIRDTAFKEFDTYLQIAFHGRALWVRLSGQIYLEVEDFEKVGERLKELCRRVEKEEFR